MKAKQYLKNFFKYVKSGGVVVLTNVSVIKNEELFKGKVALVTGGSSGFGFAIAKRLLASGCKVIITGRNVDKLNKAVAELANANVYGMVWDLCDFTKAQEKLQEAITHWGTLDICINNAGVWTPKSWKDIGVTDWDKVIDTNLKGLFFICQAEAGMLDGTTENIKKIINITSIEGLRGGFGPYYASKWGANGITKGMAKSLVKRNIIINAIAPGMGVTDINPTLPKDVRENAYLPNHPNSRYVLVEEVAELAAYLSSDAANCIVGQVIAIDGGWSLN